MTKEYLIQSRIKNALLFKKIEEKGYSTLKEFCEKHELSYGAVVEFLNLKRAVFKKNGDLDRQASRLLEIFQATPDELFPARQMNSILLNNKKMFFANEEELTQIDNLLECDEPTYLQIEQEEQTKEDGDIINRLEQQLTTLTPREERVLRLRFGINCEPKTLREIAIMLGVQQERIRQIETRALRKLQHPKRSRFIKYGTEKHNETIQK